MKTAIAGRQVGEGAPCLIVAEAGTSHQGSRDAALAMIDAVAEAGADCVKFQLVFADEILHPRCGLVDLPTGKVDLYRQFKEIEQDVDFYRRLKEHAEKRGLLFLCSAFGLRSARMLRVLGAVAIKVASPELNHFPLLREVSSYGIPLVLSSGVSALADIERAIAITGRNIVLLHCITAYPAPEEEYNLRLVPNLSRIFGVPTGVSDHSQDPVLVPVLAVAQAARAIEKHVTLSHSGGGLDDPIALDPSAFTRMVREIRRAEREGAEETMHRMQASYGADRLERVLGNGIKELAPSERRNYGATNRSIHALRDIPQGERIREDAVALVRSEKNLTPGLGPELLPIVVGATARRGIAAGAGVGWDDIIERSGGAP